MGLSKGACERFFIKPGNARYPGGWGGGGATPSPGNHHAPPAPTAAAPAAQNETPLRSQPTSKVQQSHNLKTYSKARSQYLETHFNLLYLRVAAQRLAKCTEIPGIYIIVILADCLAVVT